MAHPFYAYFVFTFSTSGHKDVLSGYAILRNLVLMLTLPAMSTSLNWFMMTLNSCWMDNSAEVSILEISEKLICVHMKCTDCNRMLPTPKEVNSQAQGSPWVYLRVHLFCNILQSIFQYKSKQFLVSFHIKHMSHHMQTFFKWRFNCIIL